ncbi:aminotransferase [Bacillus anthracis]|nr:aminotransferase [Bacillus anthracis]
MQLFHKTVNRRGTHSIKWDTYKNEELIHAWIADMDFEVPQPIQTALKKRIEHPIFGYTLPPENIGDIICNWTKNSTTGIFKKNGLSLAPESFQPLVRAYRPSQRKTNPFSYNHLFIPHFSKWSQQITDNYA